MNKRNTLMLLSLMAAGFGLAFFLMSRGRASQPGTADSTKGFARGAEREGNLLAGPGRVEPVSEDIKVGSEISGKLSRVLVEEGDRVQRGQILAILVNDDYRAQVSSAEADVRQKKAELRKTINGARRQERLEALAAVGEAEAVMENARAEMERRQRLYRDGVVSREEADRFGREYKVAKARYDEAAQHHQLIDDAAREEDRSRAEADVALAQAQLEEARARYAKTFVRSPITGIVLRKYHRPGESVTNSANSPDPIVALGDATVLRVRVDVDETDVSRVKLGQRAYVTADAYGNRKFWGHVVRVGQELGKKISVRMSRPST
jgi:HlyD family secretion protein